MNSFEEDYHHTQDPERDGGTTREDHPTQAGQDQRLDGEVVGDRDQHRHGGEHHSPDQTTVAGTRRRHVSIEWIELGNDEVYGNGAPENESAPEWHVLGDYEEVGLTAEVLLPGHLGVHDLRLVEEVRHLAALVISLSSEICSSLGLTSQIFTNLRNRKHNLLQ